MGSVRRFALLLIVVTLLLIGGSCGSDSGNPAQTTAAENQSFADAFPAPSELRFASYTEADLTRTGSQYEPAQLLQNAAADGSACVFSPDWEPGDPLSGTAHSLYRFTLEDYDRSPTLHLLWQESGGSDTTFVGVSDWDSDSWIWTSGVKVELTEAQMQAAIHDGSNELLAIVVVIGHTGATLNNIRVGSTEGELDVIDITMHSEEDFFTNVGVPTRFSANISGQPDNYYWSFAHNIGTPIIYSNDIEPVITFDTEGPYVAQLFIENGGGFAAHSSGFSVSESPIPVIESVSGSNDPFAGNSTIFRGHYKPGGGNQPTQWAWDFGGGATPANSTEERPQVELGQVGSYECSLTASNDDGSDTYEWTLVVRDPNTPPDIVGVVDEFSAMTPGEEYEPRLVNEGGSLADLVSIDWEFGEGAIYEDDDISENRFPETILLHQGTYQASVTIVTDFGSDSFEWEYTVGDPGHGRPIIVLVTPDAASEFEEVTFEAMNVGAPATSWQWSWSDGPNDGPWADPPTSTDQSPTVTLGATGPTSGGAGGTVTAENAEGLHQFFFDFFITTS